MTIATAVVARGTNQNRVWVRLKLLDNQAKELHIGDVIFTRREKVPFVVESWDDTKVHVRSLCEAGYFQSFYPAMFSLMLVEV